jgi:C4-type Zn-finger protein
MRICKKPLARQESPFCNRSCWFAPEDLKIADKLRTRIDESIRLYDKLVVILTENSTRSAWVEEEVKAALEKERKQARKRERRKQRLCGQG